VKKILFALAVPAAVVAASVSGFGATSTADGATVSFISWRNDVIYVYDMTASLKEKNGSPVWPVRAAAERWDDGNPVDFRYTTKGCPKNTQCVTVRQSELAAPAAGVTATGFVGADIKSSNITLDTTFEHKNSAAKRRNVVCHELGHSLGLKHRTATSSCLTSYVTSERYPDAADIKNLQIMYGYR
jgi:hypothetical protein